MTPEMRSYIARQLRQARRCDDFAFLRRYWRLRMDGLRPDQAWQFS